MRFARRRWCLFVVFLVRTRSPPRVIIRAPLSGLFLGVRSSIGFSRYFARNQSEYGTESRGNSSFYCDHRHGASHSSKCCASKPEFHFPIMELFRISPELYGVIVMRLCVARSSMSV